MSNVRNFLPKNLPAADVIFLTADQSKRLISYVVNSSNNLRTQLVQRIQGRHRRRLSRTGREWVLEG